jgi:hypothetical protein
MGNKRAPFLKKMGKHFCRFSSSTSGPPGPPLFKLILIINIVYHLILYNIPQTKVEKYKIPRNGHAQLEFRRTKFITSAPNNDGIASRPLLLLLNSRNNITAAASSSRYFIDMQE